jgi:hypothetical protein
MGVERFEDLIAWQKARQLTRAICEFTRRGPWAKDFGLAGQIQRVGFRNVQYSGRFREKPSG